MFNAENAQFTNVTELEINEMNLLVGGDGSNTGTVVVQNPKPITISKPK
jgi:hypothetical protein